MAVSSRSEGQAVRAITNISEQAASAGVTQSENRDQGLSLSDYYDYEIDPDDTLLGNRYLCRESALLFPGPSGVGKSSASVQQDACWALGRPAFGIVPARPLRILTIQAENDNGDMHEMATGVVRGLGLTEEDRAVLGEHTLYVANKSAAGESLFVGLRVHLERFRPDILRIDPLQAYLGGDPKDSALVSAFCRAMLNPLLQEFQCGAIVNHHTPKTNFRNTSTWKASDWMYAGAGAADLTNWARAVLVIESEPDERGLFRFIAAKRGSRIGWHDQYGQRVYERHFRHAREGCGIFWEEADPPPDSRRRKASKEDILNLVPEEDPIRKDALISKARSNGIPNEKRIGGFIAELESDGQLFTWEKKRSGTRPQILLARRPQPPQTEMSI